MPGVPPSGLTLIGALRRDRFSIGKNLSDTTLLDLIVRLLSDFYVAIYGVQKI